MKADARFSEIRIPLSNEGLPPGWGPWDLPDGWTLEPEGGPGKSPALRHTRKDVAEYMNARLKIGLEPEKSYALKTKLFVEEAFGKTIEAKACVEFFDAENRYLGGGHMPAAVKPGEWKDVHCVFTVPRYTAECRLMYYVAAGCTGSARFADPSIAPADFAWTAYPLTLVRDELPASGGIIEFAFFSQGEPKGVKPDGNYSCKLELQAGKAKPFSAVAMIKNGRFCVKFGQLPIGPASITFTIVDSRGNTIGTRSHAVTIVDKKTIELRKKSGVTMDELGRVLVRNRLYMPIGFYMGMVERNELDELEDSPFNCLLPYGSSILKFAESKKQGLAAAKEVMDECAKRDIKIIFCLSGAYDDTPDKPAEGLGAKGTTEIVKTAARAFGKHPALLAWYINDEQPLECIPRLLERRELIRSLDPLHPMYAVMCQVPELPFYTPIVDIYGIDPYPIVDPACNHIRSSRYTHDMAQKAISTSKGTALWTVVQAHNIGAYDHKAKRDPVFYRKEFRDPSFDEILGLALLAAVRGAKGFLFYSYPDLAHPTFDAAARPHRWANTKRAAQTLRDLESFILSAKEAAQPKIKVLEGEVEAKAFRNDKGEECIMIIGIGPGRCKAEITTGKKTQFASHFRWTTGHGGKYIFEGWNVCADILTACSTGTGKKRGSSK